MERLPILPRSEQPDPCEWVCGCPVTFGDPADFCPACLRDYNDWLDGRWRDSQEADLLERGLVLLDVRLGSEGGDL